MYRSYSPNGSRAQQARLSMKQLLVFGVALLLVSTLAVWYFAVLPVREELGECEDRTDDYRTKWEAAERENSRMQEAKFLLELEVKELEDQLEKLEERERDELAQLERRYVDAMDERRRLAAEKDEDFAAAGLLLERTLADFEECNERLADALEAEKALLHNREAAAAVCEEDLFLCDMEAAECLAKLEEAEEEEKEGEERLKLLAQEVDSHRDLTRNCEAEQAETQAALMRAIGDLAHCESLVGGAVVGDDDGAGYAAGFFAYRANEEEPAARASQSVGGDTAEDFFAYGQDDDEVMMLEAEYRAEEEAEARYRAGKEEDARYLAELLGDEYVEEMQEEYVRQMREEEEELEARWAEILAQKEEEGIREMEEMAEHDEELYKYFQDIYGSGSEVYVEDAWKEWEEDEDEEAEAAEEAEEVAEDLYVLGIMDEEEREERQEAYDYDSNEFDDDFDEADALPAFLWQNEDDDAAEEALEPESDDLFGAGNDDEDEVLAELEYAWDREEEEEEELDRYDDDEDVILRYDDDDDLLFGEQFDLEDLADDDEEEEEPRMARYDLDGDDGDYWN